MISESISFDVGALLRWNVEYTRLRNGTAKKIVIMKCTTLSMSTVNCRAFDIRTEEECADTKHTFAVHFLRECIVDIWVHKTFRRLRAIISVLTRRIVAKRTSFMTMQLCRMMNSCNLSRHTKTIKSRFFTQTYDWRTRKTMKMNLKPFFNWRRLPQGTFSETAAVGVLTLNNMGYAVSSVDYHDKGQLQLLRSILNISLASLRARNFCCFVCVSWCYVSIDRWMIMRRKCICDFRLEYRLKLNAEATRHFHFMLMICMSDSFNV